MTDPCERCKRASCPERCFPKLDYMRGMRKRNGRHHKQQGKEKKSTVL